MATKVISKGDYILGATFMKPLKSNISEKSVTKSTI